MEISNPRRLLAVSKPDSGLLELIEGLTGSCPTFNSDTVAGTTHNWAIKTNYYTATIPIWLDEISEPSVWATEFLAPEAREVLQVLGGIVVAFKKPVTENDLNDVRHLLENVSEVVKEGCGLMWDGVCLAVAMPQSTTPYLEKSVEDWEELCQDSGFTYVDFEGKGRNEYNERLGLERLKEALVANEWEGNDDLDDVMDPDDFDEDDPRDGFGIEAAEMEMEMVGMKQAIHGTDGASGEGREDEEDVEKLQAMMVKMQAVRDLGADMPEAERKRFAAKAVNDIMKTM